MENVLPAHAFDDELLGNYEGDEFSFSFAYAEDRPVVEPGLFGKVVDHPVFFIHSPLVRIVFSLSLSYAYPALYQDSYAPGWNHKGVCLGVYLFRERFLVRVERFLETGCAPLE